jgi:hypothetical protein
MIGLGDLGGVRIFSGTLVPAVFYRPHRSLSLRIGWRWVFGPFGRPLGGAGRSVVWEDITGCPWLGHGAPWFLVRSRGSLVSPFSGRGFQVGLVGYSG